MTVPVTHGRRRSPPAPRRTFPSADQIAQAMVMAAMEMCELSLLVKQPDKALRGLVAFRARWVALQALCALNTTADPRAIGRLIGCGTDTLRMALRVRDEPWWSDDRVVALIAALASGAPMAADCTPRCAFVTQAVIRARLEDRL